MSRINLSQQVGLKWENPAKNHLTHPQGWARKQNLACLTCAPCGPQTHTTHSGEMIEWLLTTQPWGPPEQLDIKWIAILT